MQCQMIPSINCFNLEFFLFLFNCTPIFYVRPQRGTEVLKLLLQNKEIDVNLKNNI